MDIAQDLVRSVVRAFYGDARAFDTRHILIVDALVIHSTLRDDDLSFLMSMNLKDLHKLCGRMREDRFIAQHVRPELKEGQQRPTNRTYYYIDYRQTIDAIKWRVYTMDKAVQGNPAQQNEKKDYFCNRCKAEWTTIEAISHSDMRGLLCQRCNSTLIFDPDRQSGGHEKSTRLNNQLKFITDLLPKLDSVHIPDNTFDVAFSTARPVLRDATNQVVASVPVETSARPTAVRGMANTGPKSIAINISASGEPSEAEKAAEQARKEAVAQQNALPEWHVTSTVTGDSYTTTGNKATATLKDDDEDKKPDVDLLTAKQHQEVDEVYARIMAEQEAKRRAEEEEEDEEEEDDDDEEGEFEDVTADHSSAGATPNSTTGLVTAPVAPSPLRQVSSSLKREASSGASSVGATTPLGANTPASDGRPTKRVKVEEPADGGNDGESEDEDLAFEDV